MHIDAGSGKQFMHSEASQISSKSRDFLHAEYREYVDQYSCSPV